MKEMELLESAFRDFTGMDEKAFALSVPFWRKKHYNKGEFFNAYRNVCKQLGFILDGVFRTYYVDDATAEEKNVFFCSKHQMVVSYKSFVEQEPCNYHTAALTDAEIYYIHYDQLTDLYRQSHEWERFGRLVAEKAFSLAMNRAEDFIFLTPEQRYLALTAQHPDIFNAVPLYHIASYLGIQGPSLSRIRKRMAGKQ